MTVLKESKAGKEPSLEKMGKIRTHIDECDHHNLCRIDQILTREMNKNEEKVQWGSLIMNCKWPRM